MEYTYDDILQNENNEKEFICTNTGAVVKNIEGSLYLAHKITYSIDGNKDNNNIIHLKRNNDKIQWKKITKISFWLNAKYKQLVHPV